MTTACQGATATCTARGPTWRQTRGKSTSITNGKVDGTVPDNSTSPCARHCVDQDLPSVEPVTRLRHGANAAVNLGQLVGEPIRDPFRVALRTYTVQFASTSVIVNGFLRIQAGTSRHPGRMTEPGRCVETLPVTPHLGVRVAFCHGARLETLEAAPRKHVLAPRRLVLGRFAKKSGGLLEMRKK